MAIASPTAVSMPSHGIPSCDNDVGAPRRDARSKRPVAASLAPNAASMARIPLCRVGTVAPFLYEAAACRVIFARGSIERAGEEAAVLGKRVLVITTPEQREMGETMPAKPCMQRTATRSPA